MNLGIDFLLIDGINTENPRIIIGNSFRFVASAFMVILLYMIYIKDKDYLEAYFDGEIKKIKIVDDQIIKESGKKVLIDKDEFDLSDHIDSESS
jgi:hypothetical protein